MENAFTYKALPPAPIPAPTITSIKLNSDFVTGGILTTIIGTNIDKNAKAYFGETEVPINYYYDASKIRVLVTAAAAPGVVDIKVVNPDGQGAVLESAFTYEELPLGPAPTITLISPNSSLETGGVYTYIEGTDIGENAKVYFGDKEVAINYYYSPSKIRVLVPAATPGVVDVKNC